MLVSHQEGNKLLSYTKGVTAIHCLDAGDQIVFPLDVLGTVH